MENQPKELFNCCADRLPYKVEKAAIYFKLRGSFVLNNANTDLSIDQFIALETIAFNSGICQRDLSKIILKDRSNITRILNILETKGLITRELASKGNRPIKIMKLTSEGQKIIDSHSSLLNDDMEMFLSDFKPEELEIIKNGLDKIIDKISTTVSIQI